MHIDKSNKKKFKKYCANVISSISLNEYDLYTI